MNAKGFALTLLGGIAVYAAYQFVQVEKLRAAAKTKTIGLSVVPPVYTDNRGNPVYGPSDLQKTVTYADGSVVEIYDDTPTGAQYPAQVLAAQKTNTDATVDGNYSPAVYAHDAATMDGAQ